MPTFVKSKTLNVLGSDKESKEQLIEYLKLDSSFEDINFFDEGFLSFDVTLALLDYKEKHPQTKVSVNNRFLYSYLSFLDLHTSFCKEKTKKKDFKNIVIVANEENIDLIKSFLKSVNYSSSMTIFIILDVDEVEKLDSVFKTKCAFDVEMPVKMQSYEKGKIYISPLKYNLKVANSLIYLTNDKVQNHFNSFENEFSDLALFTLKKEDGFLTLLELLSSANSDLSSELLNTFWKEIFRVYGYDFSEYSKEYLDRRINKVKQLESFNYSSFLALNVLTNQEIFDDFFLDLSINVTLFFRNVEYINFVKENIIPYLNTFNHIKIWSAGCSTGEEAYSLAIILKEMGLLHKTYIYATDINSFALNSAKNGIYSNEKLEESKINFQKIFPTSSFENYIEKREKHFIINDEIKERVIFHKHSLVDGGVINEFHFVVCKNVMIYFSPSLIKRTQTLLYDSLRINGFLVLGASESLRVDGFKTLKSGFNIFKKSGK